MYLNINSYIPLGFLLLAAILDVFFSQFCTPWVAGGFCKLLGLWRGDDPAECTDAIHIPWVTSDALGLVEIRQGEK